MNEKEKMLVQIDKICNELERVYRERKMPLKAIPMAFLFWLKLKHLKKIVMKCNDIQSQLFPLLSEQTLCLILKDLKEIELGLRRF
ncbi:MAG: hypothetical protein KH020_17555 [Clostridiales bacterium]|nr:hypothetical protein [Clostridiales bacterium]